MSARASTATSGGRGSFGQKGSSSARSSSAVDGSSEGGFFSAPARILAPRLLFIASVVLLCALGLVMVYSSSSVLAYDEYGNASYYFDRQAVFMAIGALACVVVAAIPHGFWSHPVTAAVVWGVSVLLLAVTALSGVSALGAERSISIGGFTLQPAEFAKIAVLIAFAALCKSFREGRLPLRQFVVLALLSVAVPIALIFQQPDLGTAVILLVGVLALMILGGFPWRIIFVIIGVCIAYIVAVCIVQPYHLDRIMTMFDPWLDPTGDGYQSIQSLYAFGSGGVFGVGLGLSRQKYLYLPYAHTDFIFAIIGEELGLVGSLATVALFVLFVFSGLRISRNAPDVFGCLVSGSMTVMIGFQAFVNMACVTGIAPVTGKALPFISYGGSSLLATLLMVGVVLSVSLRSKVGAASERRRDSLRVFAGGAAAGGAAAAASKAGSKKRGRPSKEGVRAGRKQKTPAASSSSGRSGGRGAVGSGGRERGSSARVSSRSKASAPRPGSEAGRTGSKTSASSPRRERDGGASSSPRRRSDGASTRSVAYGGEGRYSVSRERTEESSSTRGERSGREDSRRPSQASSGRVIAFPKRSSAAHEEGEGRRRRGARDAREEFEEFEDEGLPSGRLDYGSTLRSKPRAPTSRSSSEETDFPEGDDPFAKPANAPDTKRR